ncbi:MAG TPA: hypothetical protein VJN22_02460 [Candidatus Eremiobacteraceae bacterium]|nr:hypothetical protein [Candidatus Eremiobacteraceae bacterium]
MFRFAIFASLSLCLAGSALAFHATHAGAVHLKREASADKAAFAFSGKVTKVDYAANVVELASQGRRVSIVVEPTTAIDVAGEPGSVSDIRPGVKMHVEGIVRDGMFVAQTITIRRSGKERL